MVELLKSVGDKAPKKIAATVIDEASGKVIAIDKRDSLEAVLGKFNTAFPAFTTNYLNDLHELGKCQYNRSGLSQGGEFMHDLRIPKLLWELLIAWARLQGREKTWPMNKGDVDELISLAPKLCPRKTIAPK